MNQEIVKNNSLPILNSIANNDLKETLQREGKDKTSKDVPMLRVKPKSKMTLRPGTQEAAQGIGTYAQCFSTSNFTSQYEDECPVNYSLKYSETEPCKPPTKCETSKKKFKDYTDYAETDLDQPTDFSLKYAEKTYDDDNKNIPFTYYNNPNVRFKEYTDYVETDLDQPTDFTLKYRESAEEDIKNEFNFYENEERKPSTVFPNRTEDPERLPSRFPSQDETPLMFSRSSSLNSLSSFVHITQSIPDDRSSVVSDFSRMTSGIISPSELPDSPTQTAPSSPKRVKALMTYPPKKSVFEDDVATYKQEDTPIEFSRATSTSSLNIDSTTKSDIKRQHSGPSSELSNEITHTSEDLPLKPDDKIDHDKGKFELASVLEVDESLFADCISIDIQINCRKPKPAQGRLIVTNEGSSPFRQGAGFTIKPNLRLRFQSDTRKGYAPYELSDDAVHTYHTEGTPANVSHAGSHSDLSALSVASGIPGVEDSSDNESFFPEGNETMCRPKTSNSIKGCDGSDAVGRNTTVGPQLEYLREDELTGKDDETGSLEIDSSPCNFLRSSLGDLTVNVMDQPLSIARADNCEETPSQMLSPLRNVSPQSPNSIVFEEADDADKGPEELLKEDNDAWDEPNETEVQSEQNAQNCSRVEFSNSNSIDLESNLPLTAFEEALLEECIRLGMPPKRNQNQMQETHFKIHDEGKHSEEADFTYSKSVSKEVKHWNSKKCSDSPFPGPGTPNSVPGDNFDFDSSEPLTPFEEVLLEQCIQLGMPQKKTYQEGAHLDQEGMEDFDCDSGGMMTPLDTALVEQCIRLGMPQKKKREGSCEESSKAVSCLAAHLNKLKLNGEAEKEKKCEACQCGKRHAFRRKNTGCRRTKNKPDHFKVESCPV